MVTSSVGHWVNGYYPLYLSSLGLIDRLESAICLSPNWEMLSLYLVKHFFCPYFLFSFSGSVQMSGAQTQSPRPQLWCFVLLVLGFFPVCSSGWIFSIDLSSHSPTLSSVLVNEVLKPIQSTFNFRSCIFQFKNFYLILFNSFYFSTEIPHLDIHYRYIFLCVLKDSQNSCFRTVCIDFYYVGITFFWVCVYVRVPGSLGLYAGHCE